MDRLHYSPVSWKFIRGPTIAPALAQISVADSLAFSQPSGISLNTLGLFAGADGGGRLIPSFCMRNCRGRLNVLRGRFNLSHQAGRQSAATVKNCPLNHRHRSSTGRACCCSQTSQCDLDLGDRLKTGHSSRSKEASLDQSPSFPATSVAGGRFGYLLKFSSRRIRILLAPSSMDD
jgi:hypothetical protein